MYRLQFPDSELAELPVTVASQVVVPASAVGMALVVIIMTSDAAVALPGNLPERVIGMLDRKNGGRVAIFATEVPFDADILAEVDSPPDELTPWAILAPRRPPNRTAGLFTVVWMEHDARLSSTVISGRRVNSRCCCPDFQGWSIRGVSDRPTSTIAASRAQCSSALPLISHDFSSTPERAAPTNISKETRQTSLWHTSRANATMVGANCPTVITTRAFPYRAFWQSRARWPQASGPPGLTRLAGKEAPQG